MESLSGTRLPALQCRDGSASSAGSERPDGDGLRSAGEIYFRRSVAVALLRMRIRDGELPSIVPSGTYRFQETRPSPLDSRH